MTPLFAISEYLLIPGKARVIACWIVLSSLFTANASIKPASHESPERYNVTQWTTDNNLPQNSIQCMLQTREGYLWIGTRAGLARFDGVKMRVFNAANTPEMSPSDNCMCMTEDKSGQLWIGTKNGVLAYRNGQFRRLEIDTFPDSALAKSVCTIASSRDGGLWVSTEFGIQRWKAGAWQMITNFPKRYLHTESNKRVRNYVTGTRIIEEENGSVWIGGGGGLFHSPDGEQTFEQIPGISEGDAPYLGAQRLTKGGSGGFWFWNEQGIFHYTGTELKAPWKASGDQLPCILGSDGDGVWVRSFIWGIGHFNGAQFTWIKTPNLPLRDIQLGYQDHEGNLWLGTESHGLFRLKPYALINYTTEDGLSSDDTWSISQAPDGTVWVGAAPGLNAFKGEWKSFLKQGDGPNSSDFTSALADSNDVVWLGREYLHKFHKGQFTPVALPANKELLIWGARTIYKARNGVLWASSGPGLVQITDTEWRFKFKGLARTYDLLAGAMHESTNSADSLTYDGVAGILEDCTGAIWAGGREGKVTRIKNGKFETFGAEKGIPAGVVGPVLADDDGTVWFCSTAGMLRWKEGRFTRLARKQGLPEDIVLNVLEDNFGNFWLNGHHGIHRARKKDVQMAADGLIDQIQFTSFDEADGMRRSEGNGETFPNSCKTSDGRLWFPTMGGVVVIDPKKVLENTKPIPVIIEQVLADDEIILGEGIAQEAENRRTRSDAGGEPRIRLEPGRARVLKIRYTAPTMKRPKKVQFRYRLHGQEENWVKPEPGADRVAYYTNLRPGKYHFEIQADDTQGSWGEPTTFSLVLAPHIWETRLFYVLCGGAILGTALALHNNRLKVLRQISRLEQQHALEQERSRIARDMHDDLGASLTKIQFLSALADRANPREGSVSEQLQTIAQTAREATQGMDEIVWAVNPRNDRLENLADYLGSYAEEFLKTAGLRYKLNIPAELPVAVMSTEVRYALFLVVKECLNNIAKHAQARVVQFEVFAYDETLDIVITDDGIGFDSAQLSGSGDGLGNLQQRIGQFGGKIKWSSNNAHGTTVRISLPLKRKDRGR